MHKRAIFLQRQIGIGFTLQPGLYNAAVSNVKKVFATNLATGASLSPHLLKIDCVKDWLI